MGVRASLGELSGGRARAEAAGMALRLDGEALLELLAADTALLQGVFFALLEAAGKRGAERVSEAREAP